jgi:hypothetical protein
LFRSHRWIFPFVSYALLLVVGVASGATSSGSLAAGGVSSGTPLRASMDWSGAMLVPVLALLTRSMLTAEPDASRACVAAAAGPMRAHLATLLTAICGGLVLALAGAGYDVLTYATATPSARPGTLNKLMLTFAHPQILLGGLVTAVVCLLVGSAVGTLFNRPLLRHPAAALLGTLAAVVVALVSDVSPASASLRGSGATVQASAWPSGVPLLAAVLLCAFAWTASALAAAHRAG